MSGGGFGTINTIKKDDKEDDEDTNKYFVGGANGRGGGSNLMVKDPKKKDENEGYGSLIEKAKQDSKERPLEEGETQVQITLYRNGFVVNDGDFRSLQDVNNQAFIDTLKAGDCPPELMVEGRVPAVKLTDKSKEDYEEPRYVAFRGQGLSLGASTLKVKAEEVISIEGGKEGVNVNEKEKTIRVQIRYPGGKKQVAKFNIHHTVNDLIKVVRASGMVDKDFALQTAKRALIPSSTFSMTIKAAGLANSVVTVVTQF